MKRILLSMFLITSPAFAASTGEAAFAPGTAVPKKLVVGETIWACADGRCTGPAESRTVAMQRACHALAREIGAVATFTVGASALTPEALRACNEKAGRDAQAIAAR